MSPLDWGIVAANALLTLVIGVRAQRRGAGEDTSNRVRAWKGRSGLHPELADVLRAAPTGRTTVVALCGPAALGPDLPPELERIVAWGDEACAQRAAAAALLGAPTPGRVPRPGAAS